MAQRAKPKSKPRARTTRKARKAAPVARAPAGRERMLVLINRKSGTVRSRGAEAVKALAETALRPHFSDVDVVLFDGNIAPHVEKARDSKSHDIIVAGGGDGTLATTAGLLMGSDRTMACLPLGTMNLYTQALGFSAVLEEALAQLPQATAREVDVGLANGRAFLHQVSFGLQPRMARLRERMGYSSRLTKMLGSLRAFVQLAIDPRSVRVDVADGAHVVSHTTPLLIVSNNLLGAPENISLQDKLDDGVLGLYVLRALSFRALFKLARSYLSGSLHSNDEVQQGSATAYTITRRPSRLPGHKKRKAILASMDGEVVVLRNPVDIETRPRSLRVLALPKRS